MSAKPFWRLIMEHLGESGGEIIQIPQLILTTLHYNGRHWYVPQQIICKQKIPNIYYCLNLMLWGNTWSCFDLHLIESDALKNSSVMPLYTLVGTWCFEEVPCHAWIYSWQPVIQRICLVKAMSTLVGTNTLTMFIIMPGPTLDGI